MLARGGQRKHKSRPGAGPVRTSDKVRYWGPALAQLAPARAITFGAFSPQKSVLKMALADQAFKILVAADWEVRAPLLCRRH